MKGKLDAVMGGSLYLTPSFKGFGGSVTDIRVKTEEGKVSAYETEWNGSSAELYTNENFVPTTGKIMIPMEVVLSTGRVLPFTVSTKPTKGVVSLDVYDAVLTVPEAAEGEEPASVSVPVIATYTYDYYIDAKTKCRRVYTVDLSTEKGKAFLQIGEAQNGLSKDGVYAGGDAVTGAATVILAMGAGKKAARRKRSQGSLTCWKETRENNNEKSNESRKTSKQDFSREHRVDTRHWIKEQ